MAAKELWAARGTVERPFMAEVRPAMSLGITVMPMPAKALDSAAAKEGFWAWAVRARRVSGRARVVRCILVVGVVFSCVILVCLVGEVVCKGVDCFNGESDCVVISRSGLIWLEEEETRDPLISPSPDR